MDEVQQLRDFIESEYEAAAMAVEASTRGGVLVSFGRNLEEPEEFVKDMDERGYRVLVNTEMSTQTLRFELVRRNTPVNDEFIQENNLVIKITAVKYPNVKVCLTINKTVLSGWTLQRMFSFISKVHHSRVVCIEDVPGTMTVNIWTIPIDTLPVEPLSAEPPSDDTDVLPVAPVVTKRVNWRSILLVLFIIALLMGVAAYVDSLYERVDSSGKEF